MTPRSFLNSNGVNSTDSQTLLSQVDYGKVFGFVEAILQAMLGVFSNLLLHPRPSAVHGRRRKSYGARMRIVTQMRPDIATALSRVLGRHPQVPDRVHGVRADRRRPRHRGAWALGIPLPLLWGLLSFITNYIPNVGFILGLVPPALLALLQGGPD